MSERAYGRLLDKCEKLEADNERLRADAQRLIDAMDDMHERGETFTARVSVASAALRRALEHKP